MKRLFACLLLILSFSSFAGYIDNTCGHCGQVAFFYTDDSNLHNHELAGGWCSKCGTRYTTMWFYCKLCSTFLGKFTELGNQAKHPHIAVGCPNRPCCNPVNCAVHNVVYCDSHSTEHQFSGRFKCEASNYHAFCCNTQNALDIEKAKLSVVMSIPCVECGKLRMCSICHAHDCEPTGCPDRDDCDYRKCSDCSENGCFTVGESHNTHVCKNDLACPNREDCVPGVCTYCNADICEASGRDHVCHFDSCFFCDDLICPSPNANPRHNQKCNICSKYFCPELLNKKHLTHCDSCGDDVCPTEYSSHFSTCTYHTGLRICRKNLGSHFDTCGLCGSVYCKSFKHFKLHSTCGNEYCPVKGHTCPDGGDDVPPGEDPPPDDTLPPDDGKKDCDTDPSNCRLRTCGKLRVGAETCGCKVYCSIQYCLTHQGSFHKCEIHVCAKSCPYRTDCNPRRCEVCGEYLCRGFGAHLPASHNHSESDARQEEEPEFILPPEEEFSFPELKFLTILKRKLIPDLPSTIASSDDVVINFTVPVPGVGQQVPLLGFFPDSQLPAAAAWMRFLRDIVHGLSMGVMYVVFCLSCWRYLNK